MRTIEVKVFTSDHKSFERFRFSPVTKGIEYSSPGAKHILAQFVKQLEAQYAGNTFKVVELNDSSYNILPEPIANA